MSTISYEDQVDDSDWIAMEHAHPSPCVGSEPDDYDDNADDAIYMNETETKHKEEMDELDELDELDEPEEVEPLGYYADVINADGLWPKLASDVETFKNEYFEVKQSPTAGLGCFAVRDMEPGTLILVEKMLFEAITTEVKDKVERLTEEQKKAYFRLHGHKANPTEEIHAAIWGTNVTGYPHHGGAVFLLGSRFNHACRPHNNVEYSYVDRMEAMKFITQKNVSAGDELFIVYQNNSTVLFEYWGFHCKCPRCISTSGQACTDAQEHDLDEPENDSDDPSNSEFDAESPE
ncbi:hypothetical protein GGR50DRAFT_701224 [Xylaria sp. CBS 124048]|nr:hypothetical protein GGR50DRAFT_701224 [Xylaria sp. CBS 124048]